MVIQNRLQDTAIASKTQGYPFWCVAGQPWYVAALVYGSSPELEHNHAVHTELFVG